MTDTSADQNIEVLDLRRSEPLPFHRPSISDLEIAGVVDTLKSGWLTTGPKTQQFTEAFSEAVDAPAGLAVSSCTAGLHLGLLAAGVGPGDVVYTTPITFAASVQVILHTGARAVLVDVQADTLNIDPTALEAAIAQTPSSERPAAVIPVHFAGHPCDMGEILALAEHHGLAVIEDAAHALPASHQGHPTGSVRSSLVPHLTAFSFYATKNLAVGEGGMLTGAPEHIETSKVLSLHGMSRDAWKRYQGGSWVYDIQAEGFKYNFTDIGAAIGLGQLARLPELQARRLEIVNRYQAAFGDVSSFQTPTVRSDVETAWHLYVLRLELDTLTIDRAQFITELDRRMIATSVHFIPIHHHSHFGKTLDLEPGDLPVADGEFPRYFSLPLYPAMTDQDIDDVVDAVLDVAATHRR